MALQSFSLTIVTKLDSPFNVLPNALIEIRERLANGSSGALASIFEDSAGTIPITQTGARTDTLGQFTFFAAAADYNAEYINNGTPVILPVATGVTGGVLTSTIDRLTPLTLAIATADVSLLDGDTLNMKERVSTRRGGAFWDVKTGQTPNGFNIVAHDTLPLQLVLRTNNVLNVREWGAQGNAAADDTTFIQAAIDFATPLGGREIFFEIGSYLITSPITIASLNMTLIAETKGTVGSNTILNWGGGAVSTAMVDVANGSHGFLIDGFEMDANLLSDICLFIHADTGTATHHPVVNNIIFKGYNSRALVMGENTLSTANGQLQLPQMNRCYWQGGALDAIGFLLNAQNCEFVVANGLYFDIEPAAFFAHDHHVLAVAGGFNVQGLLSTRANSFAISSMGSQIIVNGWRSEDGFLLETTAVQLEGPCSISDLQSRETPASMPQPSATDVTIDFQGIDSSLMLNNISLQSSVRVGATSRRNVVGMNVDFREPTAGFLFSGPSNRSTFLHRSDTGEIEFAGDAGDLLVKTAAGVSLSGFESFAQKSTPVVVTQLTAVQPALTTGDGSYFRLTSDAAYDIQGIAGTFNGREMKILNIGAFALTFKHLDAGASPASGILRANAGADIVLAQFEMIELIYDGQSSQWRMWKLA